MHVRVRDECAWGMCECVCGMHVFGCVLGICAFVFERDVCVRDVEMCVSRAWLSR